MATAIEKSVRALVTLVVKDRYALKPKDAKELVGEIIDEHSDSIITLLSAYASMAAEDMEDEAGEETDEYDDDDNHDMD